LIEESERLWNSGDRDGWLELWRIAVPGEIVLEVPAGSEPRRGFDAARRALWDETRSTSTFHCRELIVYDGAIAALADNRVTVGEETTIVPSVDTYDFDDAGNCRLRSYFAI
jgi:hypothetical protein